MIGKIFGKTVGAGGDQGVGSWAQGRINGVVIACNRGFRDDDYLSIQVASPITGRDIAVNRVALTKLAQRSAILTGHSDQLQALLNSVSGVFVAASSGGAVTQQVLPSFDVLNWLVWVPLGCLDLSATDSEVQVTVEMGPAACVVSAHAVYFQSMPDHLLLTQESGILTDSFSDLEEAYIMTLTEFNDPAGKAVNVLVQSDEGAFLTDLQGAAAASAVVGQSGPHGPLNAALIYKRPAEVSVPVQIQVTGADSAGMSILAVSRRLDVRKVSRAGMRAVAQLGGQLRAMSPDKRRAYKRAGITPDYRQVESRLAIMNTGER